MNLRHLICRTIGCDSQLGRWFEWPHRVCDRLNAEPVLTAEAAHYGSTN